MKASRTRDRGASAVEFALVLPMLLLMLGGVIDFGRYFYAEVIMSNAVREGARLTSIGSDDADPRDRAALTNVKDVAPESMTAPVTL